MCRSRHRRRSGNGGVGPMAEAKAVVLGRIRQALAAAPPEPVVVPRDYQREPMTGSGDVERFAETVDDYRAQVHRISADAIAATVASLIPPGGHVVVPADVPGDWVQ